MNKKLVEYALESLKSNLSLQDWENLTGNKYVHKPFEYIEGHLMEWENKIQEEIDNLDRIEQILIYIGDTEECVCLDGTCFACSFLPKDKRDNPRLYKSM